MPAVIKYSLPGAPFLLSIALVFTSHAFAMPASSSSVGVSLAAEILTNSPNVQNGDVVIFRVLLERDDAPGSNRVEVTQQLAPPLRLAGRLSVEEVTPQVITGDIQYRHGHDRDGHPTSRVRWTGQVAPEAGMQLDLPIRLYAPCQGERETERITHVVQARPFEGEVVSAAASVFVSCPLARLDDIVVSMEEVADSATSGRSGSRPIADMRQGLQVNLTNQGTERTVVGYWLETRYVDVDFDYDPLGMGHSQDRDIQSRYIGETEKTINQVILGPGQSRSFPVWTDMRPLSLRLGDPRLQPDRSPEAVDDRVEILLHYAILPYYEPGIRWHEDRELETRSIEHQISFRSWDLGDAPDSSNHSGIAMEAYPGVNARFPTVFNAEVSQVPGPAHARPQYFHLGRAVSVEPDADLGPQPNIDPSGSQANLDQFDDGTRPGEWQLEHCKPTELEVRVYVSPEAAEWFSTHELTGYINGWIDANRDGDWADHFGCPTDDIPLPRLATEHFVIDFPVDVTGLGAGYHSLTVPTNRVPWPETKTQQPAWIRLSLSERPSVKTASIGVIDYGDGRGHPRPFMTGETEDYLLPAPEHAVADLAIEQFGNWRHREQGLDPTGRHAGLSAQRDWSLVTDYFNKGSSGAEDVVLHFDFSGQIGSAQLQNGVRIEHLSHYRTAPVEHGIDEQRISVQLNQVGPGQRGQIILALIGDEFEWIGDIDTTIEASNSISSGNQTASFKVEIEGVTQGAFEFSTPTSPWYVRQGTTNSPDIQLRGSGHERFATESGLIPVWVYGVMVGMGQKDAYMEAEPDHHGIWSLDMTGLEDGFYQFAVGDPGACNADFASRSTQFLHGYGTVCGMAVVDSSLPVDPISITISDQNGRSFPLDNTFDWTRGDWGLFLDEGEYTLTLHARGSVDDGEIRLHYGFGSFEPKKLLPGKVPGQLEANFSIPFSDRSNHGRGTDDEDMGLTLALLEGLDETSFFGALVSSPPGRLIDTATGEGISGGKVTVLVIAEGGHGAVFIPWDGSVNGQQNPFLADEAGLYRLVPPNQPFVLEVAADGYQPYRTQVMEPGSSSGELPQLMLSPLQGPADHLVGYGSDGFVPALVEARPGQVIRFYNSHAEPLWIIAEGHDSGLLLTAESHDLTVSDPGLILFESAGHPLHHGAIMVTAPPMEDRIFSDRFSAQ